MKKNSLGKITILFVVIILFITGGSYLSMRLWGGKSEKTSKIENITANNNIVF